MRDVEPAVLRLERGQATQRLDPLALGGYRPAAATLIGRDDHVDKPLEEVPLDLVAARPGELELLVRLEERAASRECQPLLVALGDGANVGVSHGNDPAVWGRPLHPRQARGPAAGAPFPDVRRRRPARSG